MKYIVKLKDGRELEATKGVSDALSPMGLSILSQVGKDSELTIALINGTEIKTKITNLKSMEIIFE